MINIPKGTKDVLPNESYKWQYLKEKIRGICELFNVREIRTPIFEYTELFLRSIGDETDIVNKEMYTFLDKGQRSITLKPEGTAPVARSYIENSLESLSLPLKMFYITPVFRYERPQAGRLREHYQFGVEFYGDSSYYMDFEAINLALFLFSSLNIKNIELNINSIGCIECRKNYISALKEYFLKMLDRVCFNCKERYNNNPLRILDCKESDCKKIVENAPSISEFLCLDCQNHFNGLIGLLKDNGIEYKINTRLVRGLDYYNKTVFEFVSNNLGAQGTVCGGGRYDNMVAQLGGKQTPAVGFGLGLERLLMLLESLDITIPKKQIDYFILVQSSSCLNFCHKLLNSLRKKGYSADMDFTGRSLKSQFKYADKQNAKFAIVIGENEMNTKKAKVKNLSDSSEQEMEILL